MTHAPPARPSIPAYGYAAPTEADVCASLARVFGAERATAEWASACRAAGLEPGRLTTASQLERAAASLARQGAAQATVARALEIRMRTYDRLAARASVTAGGRP